jgi:hypothetical protein
LLLDGGEQHLHAAPRVPVLPETKIVGSTDQLLRSATDSLTAWDVEFPLFKSAWHACAHY